MSRRPDRARLIRESWETNAGAWTRLVRAGEIESRRVATDAAVLAAVAEHSPQRVLDVGCGEGWLARALAEHGCHVVGIDGSAALIAAAQASGRGEFFQLSYDELAERPHRVGRDPFDAIVCNFSLLQAELAPLLHALAALLTPEGRLIVQTVHPWSACGGVPYADGWRIERFEAFGTEFRQAMPWYFRTLGSWSRDLSEAGFSIERIAEPHHPQTGNPLSLVITAVQGHLRDGGRAR